MLILTVRRAGYECETQSFRAYFGLLFAQSHGTLMVTIRRSPLRNNSPANKFPI